MTTPRHATGLTIYNPDLLRKEDLIAQFVARRPLLELLLDDLRRAGAAGGAQHHLLIGTRGMGKTTLLRRLRFAIEDDPILAAHWFPLAFPEEQYNVVRLSDFWANCLDALSDMLDAQGREDEAADIDEAVRHLPEAESQRADVAQDLLTRWAERANKGLVLLLDNAGLILERLSAYDWALREALSQHNRLVVIGAAPAPIAATYAYEGAFYDFFQVHELRGLNIDETREVLLTLAALRHTPHVAAMVEQDPGRLHALRVLTGGNPRVLVVLYQVLAQGQDGRVISELEQILDLHTPYYKAVFEALSTQAQQLVDAMCLHWHPLTAATLAALPSVRLETNIVSAQLDRLSRDGVVEKAPTPAGEKLLYQVAERFFNIWYLMRASRRLRRKLIWLVDFLTVLYAPADLHAHAQRFLRSTPIPRRAEMAFAYAQTVQEPALRHALEHEGMRSMLRERREHRQTLATWLDFEGEDGELRTSAERLTLLHDLEYQVLSARVNWPGCTAEEFWQRLGGAWALRLEEKQRVVKTLETLSAPEIQDVLRNIERRQTFLSALLGTERAQTLMEAIRSGDMANVTDVAGADAAALRLEAPALKAIARLERALAQLPPPPMQEIDELRQSIGLNPDDVYIMYRFSALLAAHADLRIEAETLLRETLQRFTQHPYLWNGLGNMLSNHLQRYTEAEAAYRRAIALDPAFATAWHNLGNVLHGHLQRYEEAAAAYRRAIALDPAFATAWYNLGSLLHDCLQRYEEAETAKRKAVALAPTNASYLNSLAWFLFSTEKHPEEAEEKARQALAIAPNNLYIVYTLACILARRAKWVEAADLARRFIVEGDAAYHAAIWPDILAFFREAVRTEHAADAVALLDALGYEDRWRPLREALRAIAVGSNVPLLHMAPEIRQPAEVIVAQLLPAGITLASALKTSGAKKARRAPRA